MARSRLQKTQSGEPLVPSFGASTITSDWNSAVTRASDCTVSWQVVEVPLQAPPQPKNRAPPAGEAVSVTWLPVATMTSQVDDDSPQFSPPPVTVPGPVVEAARCACAGGGGCATKFAYTVASLERVIVQPPDPLQSVPQLSKPYPLLAAAVSVTVVPSVKSALHWEESQSRPEGDDVTRPFPCTTTVRRCLPTGGGGATAKVALTSRSASNFRSHPAVPLHAPAQPTNEEPESATAAKWTCAPAVYCAVQLPRQSAPAPRTTPLPVVEILRLTCVPPPPPLPPSAGDSEPEPQPDAMTTATQPRMSVRIASIT